VRRLKKAVGREAESSASAVKPHEAKSFCRERPSKNLRQMKKMTPYTRLPEGHPDPFEDRLDIDLGIVR
jgi:hypothetical protein